MTRPNLLSFAALTTAALFISACSSGDASLGRNRSATNPSGGSGGSGDPGSGGNGATAGTGKGSSGSGNASGGSSSNGGSAGSSAGSGGTGTPECEMFQCIRAIECVESCGGPVLSSGCCPCGPGTFDSIECDAAPPELNSECVDDTCPEGLTPVHFYGIAGPSGPQFCWCTIPCEEDPSVCPSGTSCVSIADGPGTVCYAE